MNFRINNTPYNIIQAVNGVKVTSVNTVYVGKGLTHETIQSGVNAAAESVAAGVVSVNVIIQGGIYTEDVVVPNGIHLVGLQDSSIPPLTVSLTGTITFPNSISNSMSNLSVFYTGTEAADGVVAVSVVSEFKMVNCSVYRTDPTAARNTVLIDAASNSSFVNLENVYISNANNSAALHIAGPSNALSTRVNANNIQIVSEFGIQIGAGCSLIMKNSRILCDGPGPAINMDDFVDKVGNLELYDSVIRNLDNTAPARCLTVGQGQTSVQVYKQQDTWCHGQCYRECGCFSNFSRWESLHYRFLNRNWGWYSSRSCQYSNIDLKNFYCYSNKSITSKV